MPIGRTPGDDRRSAHYRPLEITAAEQRILTLADGLLSWMIQRPWPGDFPDKVKSFLNHTNQWNPAGEPIGTTNLMFLESLDPDANRLLLDLLRSAWERRCWQVHWGERQSPHDQAIDQAEGEANP